MAKEKRATWFKVFLSSAPYFLAASKEEAGAAIQAAFKYFLNEKVPEDLDPTSMLLFQGFKSSIDEAFSDYKESIENGRKGGNTKAENAKKNNSTPLRMPYPP